MSYAIMGTSPGAGTASPLSTEDTADVPVGDLVDAVRRDEEDAWRELHARLSPRLRTEARRYRLGPADVDDVVQFTWAQFFENRHRIRCAAALPGWLLATCRNQALAIVHSQHRYIPTAMLPEPLPPELLRDGPLEVLLEREEREALVQAIRELPVNQQLLVTALLETGHTRHAYHRIAEELAMPIGSIGPTRQRAIERLRKVLQPALAA